MADSRLLAPVRGLGNLLSNSATFQSLVGAGNATAALAKILWPEADDTNVQQARPRAVIDSATGHHMYMPPVGNDHDGGILTLSFELIVPEGPNRQTAKTEWEWILNKVGDILEEMRVYKDANPGSTILFPTHFLNIAEPQRVDDDDEAPAFSWGCVYLVFWGTATP